MASHTTPNGQVTVDGDVVAIPRPGATLLEVLRGSGHDAPKGACRRGECGACTVLVGDASVMSCTMLAALVTEHVTTAAGLGEGAADLREAFADHLGFQCGFCTPGQVVRAEAVLRENPGRTRAEITAAMAGNICRCTGYRQIIDAVCDVAAQRCALDGPVDTAAACERREKAAR
ncbi:(2Fe-2S)-binding protein [Nocardioides alcanivorans]|uniref:(2Fe-2S)-binding protein n=1 Tax=Nocardioides alcanivorans TaxID=2897352 RepID=UPI001F21CD3B|nr:2Fe-2S iron-sulfur cluster-binding protein [Nocardioides alcanivorans]